MSANTRDVMLIKLQKQIPGTCGTGQDHSFLVVLLFLRLAHYTEFGNCSNAASAEFDFLIISLFEWVKELLGLQRMAGKVGMPTSPVPLLLCVEVPVWLRKPGASGWAWSGMAGYGWSSRDMAEKDRRFCSLGECLDWTEGVMVPGQGAATGRAAGLR